MKPQIAVTPVIRQQDGNQRCDGIIFKPSDDGCRLDFTKRDVSDPRNVGSGKNRSLFPNIQFGSSIDKVTSTIKDLADTYGVKPFDLGGGIFSLIEYKGLILSYYGIPVDDVLLKFAVGKLSDQIIRFPVLVLSTEKCKIYYSGIFEHLKPSVFDSKKDFDVKVVKLGGVGDWKHMPGDTFQSYTAEESHPEGDFGLHAYQSDGSGPVPACIIELGISEPGNFIKYPKVSP